MKIIKNCIIPLIDFRSYPNSVLREKAKKKINDEILAEINKRVVIQIIENQEDTTFRAEFHLILTHEFKLIAGTLRDLQDSIKKGKETDPIMKQLCDLLRN